MEGHVLSFPKQIIDFGLQGMLGETYDRFIAGDAVNTKTSPLYLPDDNKFHGIGKRAQYKMDSYWDTNHVRPAMQASCKHIHTPWSATWLHGDALAIEGICLSCCSPSSCTMQMTVRCETHAALPPCRPLRCTMRPAFRMRR